MALSVEYRSHAGVVARYHRVYQLVVRTNELVEIWVRSYVDKPERELELDDDGIAVWHEDSCYQVVGTSDAPLTVEEAYDWLKSTRPEFADAEDC